MDPARRDRLPHRGGTGIVGMWKAFDEMEKLGWVDSRRPRMVCVQAEGCAPIVRAFRQGDEFADPGRMLGPSPPGSAALGRRRLPDTQRDTESRGTALTVSDEEIVSYVQTDRVVGGTDRLPGRCGYRCGAGEAAGTRDVSAEERILLLNTGSGLKNLELLS